MLKKMIIAGSLLVLITAVIPGLWRKYDLSSDYNYGTAKLDISKGNITIVIIGKPENDAVQKRTETIAARYGFKNTYIDNIPPKQSEKGIHDYNRLMEDYLAFRNGPGWKKIYEREVDSVKNAAAGPETSPQLNNDTVPVP